jgi:hypothetical protein
MAKSTPAQAACLPLQASSGSRQPPTRMGSRPLPAQARQPSTEGNRRRTCQQQGAVQRRRPATAGSTKRASTPAKQRRTGGVKASTKATGSGDTADGKGVQPPARAADKAQPTAGDAGGSLARLAYQETVQVRFNRIRPGTAGRGVGPPSAKSPPAAARGRQRSVRVAAAGSSSPATSPSPSTRA